MSEFTSPVTSTVTVTPKPNEVHAYCSELEILSRQNKILIGFLILVFVVVLLYAIYIVFFVTLPLSDSLGDAKDTITSLQTPVSSITSDINKVATNIDNAIPVVEKTAEDINTLVTQVESGSSTIVPEIQKIRQDISSFVSDAEAFVALAKGEICTLYSEPTADCEKVEVQLSAELKFLTDLISVPLNISNMANTSVTLQQYLCSQDPTLANCTSSSVAGTTVTSPVVIGTTTTSNNAVSSSSFTNNTNTTTSSVVNMSAFVDNTRQNLPSNTSCQNCARCKTGCSYNSMSFTRI